MNRSFLLATFAVLLLLPAVPGPMLAGTGLTPDLLVWLWVCATAAALAGALGRRRRQGGLAGRLLLAGALLMTLPLLWTPAPLQGAAIPRLAGLWALVGLLWLLMQRPVTAGLRRGLYGAAAVAGALQALLALWQAAWPVSAGKWLGYDALRAGGWTPDGGLQASLSGSFLATGLACGVWLLLSPGPTPGRYRQGLNAVAVVVTAAGLIVSHSRSAQVAALLTVLLLVLMIRRSRRRRLTLAACLLAGVLAGTGGLVLQPPPGEATARLHQEWRVDRAERRAMLQVALLMIQAHPLAGQGLGSFETCFPVMLDRAGLVNSLPITLRHPHNELLWVWSEGGAVALGGLLLWLTLWLLPWRRRGRKGRWRSGRSPAVCALLTLPLMVQAMTESPLTLSALHGGLLVLLLRLALPVAVTRSRSRGACRRRALLPVAVWGLVAAGALFIATTLPSAPKRQGGEAFAHPERLLFNQAVSDLMRFNPTREPFWLTRYEGQAGSWLTRHHDSDLSWGMLRIAAARLANRQAQKWRQRGCISVVHDPRFYCPSPYPEGADDEP